MWAKLRINLTLELNSTTDYTSFVCKRSPFQAQNNKFTFIFYPEVFVNYI
ncbi:hypothetical protein GLO73106DRAFT_00012420 [Gloeocapsa sp. PCC 73106]|nr:hypothetical protein GLO73106DRAFT_00012420 [Gloeocapsa sp. PCC 73106]